MINSYMLPLPMFYEVPLNCSGEQQVTKKFLKHSQGKFRFVNMLLIRMQLLVALEDFPKKHGDVYRTIATAKMELFMALVAFSCKEPQHRCYGSPKCVSRIQ